MVSPDVKKISKKIIRFANENAIFINPFYSVYSFAELVAKKDGGCVCVPSRKECPCSDALNEVHNYGNCRCGIFVNAGRYFEILEVNSK